MAPDIESRLAALTALVEAQADELGRLRSEVAALRSPQTDGTDPDVGGQADHGPISRRRMLGKAGIAAAAVTGITASKLFDATPAAASDGDDFVLGEDNRAATRTLLDSDYVGGQALLVYNSFDPFDSNTVKGVIVAHGGAHATFPALRGYSTHSNAVHGQSERYVAVVGICRDDAGVLGQSTKGAGVLGRSSQYVGVQGETTAPGRSGVYGKSPTGAGTYGEATSGVGAIGAATTGVGVRGVSTSGTAVQATSNTGSGVVASSRTDPAVIATSNSGFGVQATSATTSGVLGQGKAYGGDFIGERAAIRLRQQATAGKPTSGAHNRGELLCDKNGALWFCTGSGTPGAWKQVKLV